MYALSDLIFSASLAIYVAVCVVTAVVRWGHRCDVYADHMDYYFPAWRTVVFCFFSNLVLLPVVFMPTDPDALIHLRLMLILSSPFFCAVLIFGYFGTVLKVNWRTPIFILSIPFVLLSVFTLVLTLIPGTQLEGKLFWWVFTAICVLAAGYLVFFILALRLIARALHRFSEENYSNPEDFPKQFAEDMILISVLHLIMSWSTTINGEQWAISFGLLVLTVLVVIFLLGFLEPHRAMDVEQLKKEMDDEAATPGEASASVSAEVLPEDETLSAERKDQIQQTIRHYVEDEKNYLNSHLTLAGLSRNCGINRTYVSLVMTERLGGFFAYVNQCRVAHAEAYKVAHPKADVDEVALASGFNNRQSYYNARKRLQ
ncbi:MAG: hypothetical protein K6G79_07050 [Bacteroidales bacterium]|nr:hypothetical protein [Bacteroidales bacterium]